ncbi:hypothetical protein ACWDBO_44655 [Streptomyces mirabilis]|uniref:hypothetical protein n=1 Tax=Streptomyces TaxID=1883 RepID=UPI0029B65659|nr:hypothetical protein [Streptomyces sp. AK02-04a]MDX3763998.1 hypothetical protein [Streptomyces sp. AK02-04a]
MTTPSTEFKALDPNALVAVSLSAALRPFIKMLEGLPRAYDGALMKQARQSAMERRLADYLSRPRHDT